MTESQSIVLDLIRAEVTGAAPESPDRADWKDVMGIARVQGVYGLCMDAVVRLPSDARPHRSVMLEWIGNVNYMEEIYERHVDTLSALARFYAENGIPMLLLKGYGLSLFWPNPIRRQVGDIDIYLYGRWREADSMIAERFGIKVDNSHHHHSVFRFRGTMVEDHYDFLNTRSHDSNKWIEDVFKVLADESRGEGEKVLGNVILPSAMLNALYVVRHAACHFAAEKITLRNVLDWAFLMRGICGEIDRESFSACVREMGMMDFVSGIKELCVRYLVFESGCFPVDGCVQEGMAERILADILEPEDTGGSRKGLDYVAYRTALWWNNRWKHKMVYSDSLLRTFIVQIKSHLMKPKTIFGN